MRKTVNSEKGEEPSAAIEISGFNRMLSRYGDGKDRCECKGNLICHR